MVLIGDDDDGSTPQRDWRAVLATVHARGGARVVAPLALLESGGLLTLGSRRSDDGRVALVPARAPPAGGVRAARVAARAELEAEEDEAFESGFLGSASDVDEYPDGWICPFLPSPVVRARRLGALLPLRAADHVLDIGCGDGVVLVEVGIELV